MAKRMMLIGSYLAVAPANNSLGIKTSGLSFLVAFAFAKSGFRIQRPASAVIW
jgi:hypothetical protein